MGLLSTMGQVDNETKQNVENLSVKGKWYGEAASRGKEVDHGDEYA